MAGSGVDFKTINLVNKWYKENVEPTDKHDSKVRATLEYVKRIQEPTDGEYTVWAYEVVGGKHGQYTTRMFLDEILCQGQVMYMSEEFTHEDYQDTLMRRFDEVSNRVAQMFNRNTKLPGKFFVGHNEADGSLGVFYTETV